MPNRNPLLVSSPSSRRGLRWILRENGSATRTSMRLDFGLLVLERGETVTVQPTLETVWVLLRGRVSFACAGQSHSARRDSVFDENPSALRCGAGERVEIGAHTGVELAQVQTVNPRYRGAEFFPASAVAAEDRGAGLAQGACRRAVRAIFDHASRPDSNLVIGEVVNRAGLWSSYPPHHHAQPEIYHYRFTEPQGYGHAEVGEQVMKVRDGDTVRIPGGLDHAQVAAPGYGMYYLWVVRHLPAQPYRGFAFTAEHKWLLDPQRQGWTPKGWRA